MRALAELISLLLEETDAPAVLAAMSGALEPTASTPQALALLGELALAAYDGKRAERVMRSRRWSATRRISAALRVLARAYVMRGDADHGHRHRARRHADDAMRGGFELAEVLAALDRIEEAHQELERLRAPAASRRPRSTGAWRCWPTRPAT